MRINIFCPLCHFQIKEPNWDLCPGTIAVSRLPFGFLVGRFHPEMALFRNFGVKLRVFLVDVLLVGLRATACFLWTYKKCLISELKTYACPDFISGRANSWDWNWWYSLGSIVKIPHSSLKFQSGFVKNEVSSGLEPRGIFRLSLADKEEKKQGFESAGTF